MPRAFGCPTGKIQYDSPQAAHRDLRGIIRSRPGRCDGDIYRCPHCGKWHMTKTHRAKPKPRDIDDVDNIETAIERWRMGDHLPGLVAGEMPAPVPQIQGEP